MSKIIYIFILPVAACPMPGDSGNDEDSGTMDSSIEEEYYGDISAGGAHACAIDPVSREVMCWGSNDNGATDSPAGKFLLVSSGGAFSCAVGENSIARCWGANASNQSTAPEIKLTQISAGGFHVCAITDIGSAVCWGNNAYGQRVVPQAVKYREIDSGDMNTCAIKTDDSTLVCWGVNTHNQSDPPQGEFMEVCSGAYHSCAVKKEDGLPVCWGDDSYGQISSAPIVPIHELTCGSAHSCGIDSVGNAICWGWNEDGQVDAPTGQMAKIGAGSSFTCAITRENRGRICWGSNRYGLLDTP